jgi:hypothetical protein
MFIFVLKNIFEKILFIYSHLFSAALIVNLQDENFPAGKFEYVDGFSTVNWPKIPASSNVTHTAVVVPKTVGLFNFTHATVSYLSNDKATKSQVGYSTELGQAYIQSSREYNRRFASHTVIIFLLFFYFK